MTNNSFSGSGVNKCEWPASARLPINSQIESGQGLEPEGADRLGWLSRESQSSIEKAHLPSQTGASSRAVQLTRDRSSLRCDHPAMGWISLTQACGWWRKGEGA